MSSEDFVSRYGTPTKESSSSSAALPVIASLSVHEARTTQAAGECDEEDSVPMVPTSWAGAPRRESRATRTFGTSLSVARARRDGLFVKCACEECPLEPAPGLEDVRPDSTASVETSTQTLPVSEEDSSHLPDEAGPKLGEVMQKLHELESAVEDIPAKTVDLLGIRETLGETTHTRQETTHIHQEYESFDLLGIGEPVLVGGDGDEQLDVMDLMDFVTPHSTGLPGLAEDCAAEEEDQDSEKALRDLVDLLMQPSVSQSRGSWGFGSRLAEADR